jgi:hypothetical protein
MLNSKISKEYLESFGKPKSRVNREYLLRKGVASELNSYLAFSPFMAFADVIDESERAKVAAGSEKDPKAGAPGVKSIFNKSGAVLLGNSEDPLKVSEWRASNNVPLIDTPENRQKIRQNSGYTIKELVEASQQGLLGSAIYSYSDFMYCKYLGQLPNSYLITLRRFPTPVDDYISSAGIGKTRKDVRSSNPVPIGEMVTWLNTPGNDIDQILSYSVSMPFDEKAAKWESSGISGDNSSKPLNAASALFDKTYRDQYQKGYSGQAVNHYVEKMFPKLGAGMDPPYSGLFGWQDSNKVYGPVDAVKKVYYRGDQGIDFNHSFKLTFEYELRSYNGINGRQAMLDLISNILNVTYTTGTFWGGGYIGNGAHQNNIFANLSIFKTSGGFTNFIDAFANDVSTIKGKVESNVKANGGILNTIKNFLNDLGGMLAGGMLNKLGRPQKSQVNALLSPAPTGLWHVTIGNPFHPIMSMGNMIIKNTTITHSGPLGLDDFPTGLKVEVELDRGKPRDLRGIEMLYMNGNDRIYSSMGPHVFDMYTHAKEYKAAGGSKSDMSGVSDYYTTFQGKDKIDSSIVAAKNASVSPKMKNLLMKYFGTDDTFSIYVQAAEQEYGAWRKAKDEKKGGKTGGEQ